jgi:hypothetical protein
MQSVSEVFANDAFGNSLNNCLISSGLAALMVGAIT